MTDTPAGRRPARLRRFKPYPTYKDSGVEWLGEIPAHWEKGKLRRFWSVVDCKHRTAVYVDEGIPIVSTTEVKPGGLSLDGPRRVARADFDDLTRDGRRPRRGDVIYSRNASLGSAAYVGTDEPFCMGQDVCLVTSAGDQLYLAYQLNSPIVLGQIDAVSVGSTFERINVAQIKDFQVSRPPETEQRAIAAFLDRETARIDALVAKKERLIELLQEKRTALITRAVTKGLDPNVPMKDSGVEWLGEIPARWEVWRLKHVSGGLTVGVVVNPSQFVSPYGVAFLRGVDVTEGRIVLDRVQYMSEESNEFHHKSILRAGDLISIRVGYPGVTAVVPADLDGSNCASLLITRRSKLIDSELLCYLMNSAVGKAQFKTLQDGAAQEQINVSDAVDLLVPLPPMNEQVAIVQSLSDATSRMDALVATVRDAIERLKELRTGLISAAVTGKIDAREEPA